MKKIFVICFVALISMQFALAQTTVIGKVTSKKDKSVISGATITAKGNTTVTAVSGADGTYTIQVPADVKVLEATATGMQTKTQGIGKKKSVNFVMTVSSSDDTEKEKGKAEEKEDKTKKEYKGVKADKGKK